MNISLRRLPFYLASTVACFIMSLTTGCASGGFKLTRQYAGFVNQQHIVIRVILYILTFVVFVVTMLIDLVINNTMDFWNGSVAAGSYNFKDGGKTFEVVHEFIPNKSTQLRKSTIRVIDQNKNLLQVVVLQETVNKEIELFVDGQLRTKVRNINELPMITYFDQKGRTLSDEPLYLTGQLSLHR